MICINKRVLSATQGHHGRPLFSSASFGESFPLIFPPEQLEGSFSSKICLIKVPKHVNIAVFLEIGQHTLKTMSTYYKELLFFFKLSKTIFFVRSGVAGRPFKMVCSSRLVVCVCVSVREKKKEKVHAHVLRLFASFRGRSCK